jgi:hypothetical protein
MRDKHRDQAYFNAYIIDALKALSLYELYIGKAATPRYTDGLKEDRIITSITLCSALYSTGQNKTEIMAAYLDGLRFFCEDFNFLHHFFRQVPKFGVDLVYSHNVL